jgi:hypothetical protein
MSMNNEAFRAIANEIIAMSEADQAMRKSEVWDETVDVKNTLSMKQIIAEVGWPTVSKVGLTASQMAWLLVQHADHDREFQRTCLALMKAHPAGEVDVQNIAYLEDRVRVGEGRQQLYGTQFHTNEQGDLEPFPIEDQEHVDVRRAEVGLSTLAEYAAIMRSHRRSG